MQVEFKIITRDYELGFHIFGATRFPTKYERIVPGEALVTSQSLTENLESSEWTDVIGLVIEFSEETSVETFANWLYGKLKSKSDEILSLAIAGNTVEIDEAEIARAVKDELSKS